MAISNIGVGNHYVHASSDLRSPSSDTTETEQQTTTTSTQTPPPAPSMFSGIDLDQSGGIDQSEFETMLSKIAESSDETFDAEELFASYDSDEDGILSEEEVNSFLEDNDLLPKPPGKPDLSDIYADADSDGNGTIDSDEAQSLATMINQLTDQELSGDDLISKYDEDGDGVLSETESIAALEDNQPQMTSADVVSGLFDILNAIDTDDDDIISSEEAATLVSMINNAISEGLTVENLVEAFDGDSDGILKSTEMLTALTGGLQDATPEEVPKNSGVNHYLNMQELRNNPDQSTLSTAG